jgi:hypothetical protein
VWEANEVLAALAFPAFWRTVISRSLIGLHPIDHFSLFGGVPDSTLGWSAPLPVESRRSLVNPPSKKIIGNYEEMPMAA